MKSLVSYDFRSLQKAGAPVAKDSKPRAKTSSNPVPFAFAELLHAVRAPETRQVVMTRSGQIGKLAGFPLGIDSDRAAQKLSAETRFFPPAGQAGGHPQKIDIQQAATLQASPGSTQDGSLNSNHSRSATEASTNRLRAAAPKMGHAGMANAPLTEADISTQISASRVVDMARLMASDQWLGAQGIKILSAGRPGQAKTSDGQATADFRARSSASESASPAALAVKAKLKKDAIEGVSGEGAAISEKNTSKAEFPAGAIIAKASPSLNREGLAARLEMLSHSPAVITRIEYLRNLSHLAEKIQARAQLRSGSDAVLEILLTPPRLGSMVLRVETEGQEMRLRFGAQSEAAMQMLKDMRSDLANIVSEQGYDLRRCDVEYQAMRDHRPPTEGAGWTSGQRSSRHIAVPSSNPKIGPDGEWVEELVPRLDFGYNTLDLVA